jgi:hypothetical protein
VKKKVTEILRKCKRRIERRLKNELEERPDVPMFESGNVKYEMAERGRGLAAGGLGAMHQMVRRLGLVEAIDQHLQLLKIHVPYHESDHVLNIAFNILAGNSRLEHLERLRNDEVYLDALGTRRIPDPTTAGDFCRRFDQYHVDRLQELFNDTRIKVWRQQAPEFFEQAVIDADGTICSTDGECKLGMEYTYKKTWGFHPLIVSLANTGEPLFLVNRPGNVASHEDAAEYLDRAADCCRRAGFRSILLRGDTDFSQTARLDGWHSAGTQFVFGIDAHAKLRGLAEDLPNTAWKKLERPAKYILHTAPRTRPENCKQPLVEAHGFRDIRLLGEDVSEFQYRPYACQSEYRIVVVRKNLSIAEGAGDQRRFFDEICYLFYITNLTEPSAAEIVLCANQRCNQENLVAQLKNGVHAATMPLDCLVSNAAYMVMTALAWSIKAWYALLLPVHPRWQAQHEQQQRQLLRMEFSTFLHAIVLVPCQIIRSGRQLIFRLLSWTPWHAVLFRFMDALPKLQL